MKCLHGAKTHLHHGINCSSTVCTCKDRKESGLETDCEHHTMPRCTCSGLGPNPLSSTCWSRAPVKVQIRLTSCIWPPEHLPFQVPNKCHLLMLGLYPIGTKAVSVKRTYGAGTVTWGLNLRLQCEHVICVAVWVKISPSFCNSFLRITRVHLPQCCSVYLTLIP